MRIAVHCTEDLGGRAIRALLGDAAISGIGIWKSDPSLPHDRRIGPIEDLLGYEVLVTDSPTVNEVIADALDARIPVVVAQDELDSDGIAEALVQAQVPGLVGANLRTGISHALLTDLRAGFDEPLEEWVAWTEIGRPLRRGNAVDFPAPTGPLWSKPDEHNWFPPGRLGGKRYRAPTEGSWAGAVASVSGFVNDGVVSRTVGVADDRKYLGAIALAAGALAMAKHGLPAGMWWSGDFAEPYLEAAKAFGLATASFERSPAG